jgi:pimeloyl-ACP methyl ester carboxylesterase
MTTSTIDVGHSRVAHRREGSGPDVLFVHGWPLHSATFRKIVPLLSRRFTCHLVDLPGNGESEWDERSKIDLASHAASLRRVVDALKLERYALLAHDSGAVSARLLAAEDARVAGLVLGNTEIPGHRPKLVELFARAARLPGANRAFRTLLASRRFRRSRFGYRGCFTDPAYVDGEFFDVLVRPLIESRRAMLGQLTLARNIDWNLIDDLASVHARISAPVCLIWGARDRFFPITKAREMVGGFAGGAELIAIERAKLFAHEDHAEEFARHAEAFLARVLAAGRTAG